VREPHLPQRYPHPQGRGKWGGWLLCCLPGFHGLVPGAGS
jgi:hypothetical protein